ncbi:MAG: class I SAM-dependent methyltransferase [Verrucomicrobiales bacterium]
MFQVFASATERVEVWVKSKQEAMLANPSASSDPGSGSRIAVHWKLAPGSSTGLVCSRHRFRFSGKVIIPMNERGSLPEREYRLHGGVWLTNAEDFRKVLADSLTELSHKAEDAMLIRLLHPGKSCPKVFDFGMATGEWALMAKAYGSEVWGTDLDPRAPDACAAHGIRFTTLEEAPEGGFDFINADQVFEHLPQPLEIGRILANKLAPGGILKLTTPRDRRIEAKLERLKQGGYDDLAVFEREFFPLSPLSHINLFTARSLIELGERLGLEPFRVPLRQCYATMTAFIPPGNGTGISTIL